jgi:hypothetical protein
VEFGQFFDALTPLEQRAFAKRAGYSVESMRIHFSCAAFRRRSPSGTGFARIVRACEHFRTLHPEAPSQSELFAYFYTASRRRRVPRAAAAA